MMRMAGRNSGLVCRKWDRAQRSAGMCVFSGSGGKTDGLALRGARALSSVCSPSTSATLSSDHFRTLLL
jgi:hypothetical protein